MTSPYREPDELPKIPVRRMRWVRDNPGPICALLAAFVLGGSIFGAAFGRWKRPTEPEPPTPCVETAVVINETDGTHGCGPVARMIVERLVDGNVLVTCKCSRDGGATP